MQCTKTSSNTYIDQFAIVCACIKELVAIGHNCFDADTQIELLQDFSCVKKHPWNVPSLNTKARSQIVLPAYHCDRF